MKKINLFKERLKNVLGQLSSDQRGELLEEKNFDELSDREIKSFHDKFVNIQYSEEPKLKGKDIRGVTIFPYNTYPHNK